MVLEVLCGALGDLGCFRLIVPAENVLDSCPERLPYLTGDALDDLGAEHGYGGGDSGECDRIKHGQIRITSYHTSAPYAHAQRGAQRGFRPPHDGGQLGGAMVDPAAPSCLTQQGSQLAEKPVI